MGESPSATPGLSAHGGGAMVDSGNRVRRSSIDAIKSSIGSFLNPSGATATAAASSPPNNLHSNKNYNSNSVDAQILVCDGGGVVNGFPARRNPLTLALAGKIPSMKGGNGRADTKSLEFLVVCRFEQVTPSFG